MKKEQPIRYSARIKGDAMNHGRDAAFDVDNGYVGITSCDGQRVIDRVLLTPKQWNALVEFVRGSDMKSVLQEKS